MVAIRSVDGLFLLEWAYTTYVMGKFPICLVLSFIYQYCKEVWMASMIFVEFQQMMLYRMSDLIAIYFDELGLEAL